MGEVHPNVCSEDVYVAEINLSHLRNLKVGNLKFREISKFPSIKKDVSFIFSREVMAKDIVSDIKNSANKTLASIEVYDEYKMENERSLTFALTFLDDSRTLTEEEVMVVFNKIIDNITSKYNAKLKNM